MAHSGIFILLLVLGTSSSDSDDRRDGGAVVRAPAPGKSLILKHAIRTLLGFHKLPNPGGHPTASGPHGMEGAAPKYMMDLYQKYKDGTIMKGDRTGNTVRSIHADIGIVNNQKMFLFNLTAITKSENVFSAEIHIYKKKIKTRIKKSELRLIIYEVAPTYMSEITRLRMHGESYGWQWYDVINSVNSCLSTHGKAPHIFGMKFEAVKPSGHVGPVSIKKFMRHLSKPFLIVFSNDTQNITLDHMEPHFNAEDMKKDLNVGDFSGLKQNSKQREHRASKSKNHRQASGKYKNTEKLSKEEHGFDANDDPIERHSGLTDRKRRSIYDNEIPEHPDSDAFSTRTKNVKMPQTHPTILQSRSQSAKQRISQSKLIPYPDQFKRQRRRRKNRKNRRRFEHKVLAPPHRWKDAHENSASADGGAMLCGRRRLNVDFADIGWAQWIISPKSFDAHYCSGSCPFPLNKNLRPSNHATIQSIVHAIGIHHQVPAPCCVPDSLSSVTLLYFDEHRNVVLKNYPGMTVQSCACR